MGLLDGIIGGAVGAGLATALGGFIEKQGGVDGIVRQMEQKGLGDTVRSWVSTGPNQAITAERIHEVFGSGTVAEMAQRVGLNPDQLASKLAEILPQAIDHLTPGGQVPRS